MADFPDREIARPLTTLGGVEPVNNLVIAQLLGGIQEQQDNNYREAAERNTSPTPVMVFIEEAHEFLWSNCG